MTRVSDMKSAIVALFVLLPVILFSCWCFYLWDQGYHFSVTPPFIWRGSDQYPREHETCNILMTLATELKASIESSPEVIPIDSIEDIEKVLKARNFVPDTHPGFAQAGMTKDAWGNDLKVKTQAMDQHSRTILIYSTTKNSFPMRNGTFNLFLELTVDVERNVKVVGTTVPETGKITLRRF